MSDHMAMRLSRPTGFIAMQLFNDPLPTAEVTSREPLVEIHGNKCRGLFNCALPEMTILSSSDPDHVTVFVSLISSTP
jgi:hypothetical protein